MLKRVISFMVLTMYLHGISGYTMSFHKCTISGLENIYAGYGEVDPCEQENADGDQTTQHFGMGNCCNMQHTVICIDDDLNISYYKTSILSPVINSPLIQLNLFSISAQACPSYKNSYPIRPPALSDLCVFRI